MSLLPDALISDVGGGVGSMMMSLYNTFSHLHFAVQDTAMIEISHQVWDASSLSVLALTNQGRSRPGNSQMQPESCSKVIATL